MLENDIKALNTISYMLDPFYKNALQRIKKELEAKGDAQSEPCIECVWYATNKGRDVICDKCCRTYADRFSRHQ